MNDAMKRLGTLEADLAALRRRVLILETAPPQWPGAVRCTMCACFFQGEHVNIGCKRPDCPLAPKVVETGERPLDATIEEALKQVGD